MAVLQKPSLEKQSTTAKASKGKRKRAAVEEAVRSRAGGDDDDGFPDLPSSGGSPDGLEGEDAAKPGRRHEPAPPKSKDEKTHKKKKVKSQAAFKASQAAAVQIATSSTEKQANWLRQSCSWAVGGTFIEQEAFSGASILQLSGHGSLEEQLKSAVPEWQRTFCNSQQPLGQPQCLVVSAAALGAIDLMKKLPTFNQACRIAKLFAKHIKVPEQQQYLQQHAVCIAAGTPNRLCKLADMEALQLHQLKLIILDVRRDAKERTILDQSETRQDFWQLFTKHCQHHVMSGQAKFCLVGSSS